MSKKVNKNNIKTKVKREEARLVIEWEDFSKNLLKNLCYLIKHKSLADVIIRCDCNTIQAHKVVLAANSPLFREEFEKNPLIEQIIMGGCDFAIIKNVVEIMYSGKTVVNEEHLTFFNAVAKLLQMKHLEKYLVEHTGSTDDIYLPKPQFLTKKPKYLAYTYQSQSTQNATNSTAAQAPLEQPQQQNPQTKGSNSVINIKPSQNTENVPKQLFDFPLPGFNSFMRGKRSLKQQVEQACVKEAQASRMALANLQKEIGSTPQTINFVIEDTCTETTVENFIPQSEETPAYVKPLNYIDIVNEDPGFPSVSQIDKGQNHTEKRPLTTEKLKHLLNAQIPTKVEIMYKDADGNFVPISEEILQNLSAKEGLQYQVVDENGRLSEIQELQVIDKIDQMIHINESNSMSEDNEIIEVSKPILDVGDFLNNTETTLSIKNGLCSIVSKSGEDSLIPSPTNCVDTRSATEVTSITSKSNHVIDLTFSPDMFFSNVLSTDVGNEVSVIADEFSEDKK